MVTFNPFKKTFRFQPYSGESRSRVGNRQLEKAVVPSPGRLPMIGLVWERGEAYKAGFREGDVILKADGQAIGSFDDYVRFRPVIGHVYTFTVKDKKGFLKEIKSEWK